MADPIADTRNERNTSEYVVAGKAAIFGFPILALIVLSIYAMLPESPWVDTRITTFVAMMIFGATGAVVRIVDDFSASRMRSLHEGGAPAAIWLQVLFGCLLAAFAYLGLSERWLLQSLIRDVPDSASITTGGRLIIGFAAGMIVPSKLAATLIKSTGK